MNKRQRPKKKTDAEKINVIYVVDSKRSFVGRVSLNFCFGQHRNWMSNVQIIMSKWTHSLCWKKCKLTPEGSVQFCTKSVKLTTDPLHFSCVEVLTSGLESPKATFNFRESNHSTLQSMQFDVQCIYIVYMFLYEHKLKFDGLKIVCALMMQFSRLGFESEKIHAHWHRIQ